MSEIAKTFGIVGSNPKVKMIRETIAQYASNNAEVIILGETGTGKELVARGIHSHENSARKQKPFIKINCAAIPDTLIESELFGYERGAFTGAFKETDGKFKQADGGTLFLDEIGEMSPLMQSKVLTAIQEKKFYRIGGKVLLESDFRIIAATNRDLIANMETGEFRQDLLYRIFVLSVKLPPLRERKGDILALTAHFFESAKRRKIVGNDAELKISEAARAKLVGHSYPGNIRELENVIIRAVANSQGKEILPEHITFFREESAKSIEAENRAFREAFELFTEQILSGKQRLGLADWKKLHRIEVARYIAALAEHYFNKAGAWKKYENIHRCFSMTPNNWRVFTSRNKCSARKVHDILAENELPTDLGIPQVESELKKSIQENGQNNPVFSKDEKERAFDLQKRELDDRIHKYVSRPKLESRIQTYLKGEKRFVVIQADPGMGKSMLMARLIEKHDCIYFFASKNARLASILESFAFQLKERFRIDADLSIDSPNFQEQFAAIIYHASEKSSEMLIFALDALNDVADARTLIFEFLPEYIPANVMFLISTRPGPENENLKKQFGDTLNTIPTFAGFDRDEVRSLITKYDKLISEEALDRVLKLTDGVPIFVSAIKELLAADGAINEDELPASVDSIFAKYFAKLSQSNTDLVVKVMAVICALREPQNVDMIAQILNQRARILHEIVIEDLKQYLRMSDNRIDFYHNLFHDYVTHKLHNDEIEQAHLSIIRWCRERRNKSSEYAVKYLVSHYILINDADGLSDFIKSSKDSERFEIARRFSILFQTCSLQNLDTHPPFILLKTLIENDDDDKVIEVIFEVLRRIGAYLGDDWLLNFIKDIGDQWDSNPIARYGVYLLGSVGLKREEKETELQSIIMLCGEKSQYSLTKLRAEETLGCVKSDIEFIKRSIALLESMHPKPFGYERLMAVHNNDLAIHFARQNRFEEAERTYLIALEWDRRIPNSIDTNLSMYSMGFFYIFSMGNPMRGLPFIFKAADQRIKVKAIGRALYALRYVAYTYSNIGLHWHALKMVNYIIAFRRLKHHRDNNAKFLDLKCMIRILLNLNQFETLRTVLKEARLLVPLAQMGNVSDFSASYAESLEIYAEILKQNEGNPMESTQKLHDSLIKIVSLKLEIRPFWEMNDYISILIRRRNFSEAKNQIDLCWTWFESKGSRIAIPMICDRSAEIHEALGDRVKADEFRQMAKSERERWNVQECAQIHKNFWFEPVKDEEGNLIDPNNFDDCLC